MNITKPFISLVYNLKHNKIVDHTEVIKLEQTIDSLNDARKILISVANKPDIPPTTQATLRCLINSLEPESTDKFYYHA